MPSVLVDFNMAMNTGVDPTLIRYEVVVDGTPQTPITRSWSDADTLDLGIVGVAAVSVIVNLLSVDVNTRSADDVIAPAPQTIQVFP